MVVIYPIQVINLPKYNENRNTISTKTNQLIKKICKGSNNLLNNRKECTSVFIFQYILHNFINFVIAPNNELHYDIFYKYIIMFA